MRTNPPQEEIVELLRKSKIVAVVGLSLNPTRPSHAIASYLKSHGYVIVPVNPVAEEILGEKAYPDVSSIPFPVDIVNVFRNPKFAPEIMEQTISNGAKAVWLQESVVSEAAFQKGVEAGLVVVMDRCIYKEHKRIFSRWF